MSDDQSTNLAGTIVTLYRNHWRLFWRIMMPIAIIVIILDVALFFYNIPRFEKDISNWHSRNGYAVTSNVNTISGIHSTIADTPANLITDTRSSPSVEWRLYPIPYFSTTDTEGITWKWELNFRSLDYNRLIFLLLTLCPLSLAVARISGNSEVSGPPTAREVWGRTGRRAFTVFLAFLLFVTIVDVMMHLLYGLVPWLIPSLYEALPIELTSGLVIVSHIYLLVTLSLYNPCLILENNSIIGVFRRSHALVSGARLRFFGIYFLTGWIASVATSVLLGVTFLLFFFFVPDLAQVRDALPPLKFLSLFIGGDIEVVLPQLLSVPATVAILIIKSLIATFLVPIWAILTTLLYLERVGVESNALKEAEEL
ncbi:hypothetical protein C6500_11360 [Candidatus Poribacteria bacterium]|nr:MAG: hypothetical protein C6500_11360 [Candidatus Poribacteria bacterium]